MTKRYYYPLLLIWILGLSLYFIFNVWSIHWVAKIFSGLFVIMILFFAWYKKRFLTKDKIVDEMSHLPSKGRIVLVVGDDLSDWIEGDKPWRIYRDSIWIRIANYSDLIEIYQLLDAKNRIPECLFFILNPENYSHVAALEQSLSQWRQEIETVQGVYKKRLPVVLGIHTHLFDENLSAWPPKMLMQVSVTREDGTRYFSFLQQQQDKLSALPKSNPKFLGYTTVSTLYLTQQWLKEYVIKNLLPEKAYRDSLLLTGCVWLNSSCSDAKADWRNFEVVKTGLVSGHHYTSFTGLKDFPQIESGFLQQKYMSYGSKYLAYALISFLIFFITATIYSFTQNKAWLQEIDASHQRYIHLPQEKESERLDAIKQLKIIQQSLQDYQAYGEPNRMGFGLYQATLALPTINDDINGFKIVKKKEQVIRLDTTALFDVGESQMKENAKLVLQGVLTWIQANPNKRVLIDGHTDNTGNAELNKTLSFNRAISVRNWLVMASVYPESHFTVQGFGDTKPIADNDTEEGRSKNRRVDITLVDMPKNDERYQ